MRDLLDPSSSIRAPRTDLSRVLWPRQAALRMLTADRDAEAAERPEVGVAAGRGVRIPLREG